MRKTSLSFILFAASPLLWAQTDVKIVSQLNHQAVAIPFNRMAIPELPTQIKTALAIILPEGETVISANCGDAGSSELNGWILDWNAASNVVAVKAARQGVTSNVTIVSNHGTTYSFILKEVSLIPNAKAELKVYIEADQSIQESLKQPPKFVDARIAEEYRRAAELAHADLEATELAAKHEITRTRDETAAKAPTQIKFDYQFDRSNKAPFPVAAIGSDSRFTYIYGKFPEPPAIFEVKDGQPAIVAYDYSDGVYVIRSVVNEGSLRCGKKSMPFRKQAQ
jgi:type IV secretory pathway VirB9-like protein